MQQGAADRQGEQVIYDIQDQELADLSPDLSFVSRTNMQEQRVEHLARVIAGQDALEPASDRRTRNLHDIGVLEGGFKGQAEEHSDFVRRKARLAGRGSGTSRFRDQQVKGAKAYFTRRRLQPW